MHRNPVHEQPITDRYDTLYMSPIPSASKSVASFRCVHHTRASLPVSLSTPRSLHLRLVHSSLFPLSQSAIFITRPLSYTIPTDISPLLAQPEPAVSLSSVAQLPASPIQTQSQAQTHPISHASAPPIKHHLAARHHPNPVPAR
jgi:hypothetical protein